MITENIANSARYGSSLNNGVIRCQLGEDQCQHHEVGAESRATQEADEPGRSGGLLIAQVLRLVALQYVVDSERGDCADDGNYRVEQIEDAEVMFGHAANQDDVPDDGSDLRNRAIEGRVEQRLAGTSATIEIHLRSIRFSARKLQMY